MSTKYNYNEYNRKHYKTILIALKPEEKEKLLKVLKFYNLSLRKYLIDKLDKENI